MTDTTIDLGWSVERSRDRRTKRWSQFDRDTIDLTVAEMDLPTAEPIAAAVADAVARQAFGYPVPDESSGVPEAASAWLAERHGLAVDPDRIRLLPELMRGVVHAVRQLTRPGSAVVVPTPVYGRFFDAIAVAGRQARQVPMRVQNGRYRLDLDAIGQALADGAGSVLLCHPNNPTGTVTEPEELAGLAALADRHDARVISDEIHAPLRYDTEFTPFAAVSETAAERAITLFSATKAWNFPGLRCGLIAFTNPDDSAVWSALPRAAVGGVTPLGMEATIAAFRQGQPWLREALDFLATNRALVGDRLAGTGIGYVAPEAGYLAWLDLRRFGLADPAGFLREQTGVATTPGSDHGTAGEGFVRLNFATPPDVLADALDRITGALPR
ncbi:MalY/PatB family protein [Amycolatopsis taiwanensis]|uniref:MalY/PatB family protein n=1 Tax=Amycolatopsis taiwanensis TaxID=342230 RepID=UPI00048093CE|nr:aminotransferase class I/II-fold pyridoxal phosphate-dependent enzyme [Amycolatopsis taiwanensis]